MRSPQRAGRSARRLPGSGPSWSSWCLATRLLTDVWREHRCGAGQFVALSRAAIKCPVERRHRRGQAFSASSCRGAGVWRQWRAVTIRGRPVNRNFGAGGRSPRKVLRWPCCPAGRSPGGSGQEAVRLAPRERSRSSCWTLQSRRLASERSRSSWSGVKRTYTPAVSWRVSLFGLVSVSLLDLATAVPFPDASGHTRGALHCVGPSLRH